MSRERGQDRGEVGGGEVVRLLGLGGGRRKKKRGTEEAGTSSQRTAPETEGRERRQGDGDRVAVRLRSSLIDIYFEGLFSMKQLKYFTEVVV